ncbi:MAG: hypothetical protein HY858_14110 [Candidatus Solibacter usitatus]|nr:hypothetical protein [Candidatus Solibacter usitatus]
MRAREHFPELEPFRHEVPESTEFAVRLRYDDLPWLTRDEAAHAVEVVSRMHAVFLGLN